MGRREETERAAEVLSERFGDALAASPEADLAGPLPKLSGLTLSTAAAILKQDYEPRIREEAAARLRPDSVLTWLLGDPFEGHEEARAKAIEWVRTAPIEEMMRVMYPLPGEDD